MLIGYIRISKSDGTQNFDLQKDALIACGVDPERIYQDMASGKREDRPGLKACLKALQPGNTLVVWKLDRLGRDLKNLVSIVENLKQQNIGFKVLSGMGSNIDNTTAQGKLLFGLFATLAEFEHDLIVERTKAGLAAARARGRNGGRPRKMDKEMLKIAAAAMSDRTAVISQVAKRLGMTRSSLYKYINGDGTLKEDGIKLLNS